VSDNKNGIKVDTHVLILPDADKTWWDKCQDSMVNEPVNLHLLQGVKGHIGKGRMMGFSRGESPYVSCVDPDDMVVPGAFQACVDALEANPKACGAYTDEVLIDENGGELEKGMWSGHKWNPLLQLEPKYLHHVFVMRRKFVERHYDELLKWPVMAEYVLKCLIVQHGPWVHVDRIGYKWRIHNSGSHRRFNMMSTYAARWRVIPVLKRAAEKYGAKIPL